MNPRRKTRIPIPLLVGFAIFVVALGYLIATSLAPRNVAEFSPTPVGNRADPPAIGLVDTITVDARDPTTWRFVDFDRGVIAPPPDTAGWDLAVRRFQLIASAPVADLGTVTFSDASAAPTEVYVSTTYGRDTVNSALDRWYSYGFLSHLLRSNRNVYVLRGNSGHTVKLQLLSYYCTGAEPGCVTLRYSSLVSEPPSAR
jgi:hypothetical protein